MCYLIDTIHSHCQHNGRVQVETACPNVSNRSISAASCLSSPSSSGDQPLLFGHHPIPRSGCWRNTKLGGIKYLESYCPACLYRRRNGLEGVSITYRLDHPGGKGLSGHCGLTRGSIEAKPLRGVKVGASCHKWDLRQMPEGKGGEGNRGVRLDDEGEMLVGEVEDDREKEEREKLLQMWNLHTRTRGRHKETREEQGQKVQSLEEGSGEMDSAKPGEEKRESQDSYSHLLKTLQLGGKSTFNSCASTLSNSEESMGSGSEEDRDWESTSSVSVGWEESCGELSKCGEPC